MPLHVFAQWWEAYHGISNFQSLYVQSRCSWFIALPGICCILAAQYTMLLIFGVYGSELLDPGACIMHPPEFRDEKPRATLVESIVFDSTSRLLILFCSICPQAMRISSMLPLVGVPVSLRHQQGFALMPLGLHGPVLIILMLRLSRNSIIEHCWTLSP